MGTFEAAEERNPTAPDMVGILSGSSARTEEYTSE